MARRRIAQQNIILQFRERTTRHSAEFISCPNSGLGGLIWWRKAMELELEAKYISHCLFHREWMRSGGGLREFAWNSENSKRESTTAFDDWRKEMRLRVIVHVHIRTAFRTISQHHQFRGGGSSQDSHTILFFIYTKQSRAAVCCWMSAQEIDRGMGS